MTPEREAELFAKLDLMPELCRKLDSEIQSVKDELRDARNELRDVRQDVREVRIGQKDSGERIARVEGRLEEQSRILQFALAARQPRKPAA